MYINNDTQNMKENENYFTLINLMLLMMSLVINVVNLINISRPKNIDIKI